MTAALSHLAADIANAAALQRALGWRAGAEVVTTDGRRGWLDEECHGLWRVSLHGGGYAYAALADLRLVQP